MKRLLVFVMSLILLVYGLMTPSQIQSSNGVECLGIFITTPSVIFNALADFADNINAYRLQNGLSSLSLNSTLTALALNHSKDMAENNNLSHASSNGRTFEERMENSGLQYSLAVENIASNNYSNFLDKALEGWKNSPGHNSNLLNDHITHMGLGWAVSLSGIWYITFDAAGLSNSGGNAFTDTATSVNTSLCSGGISTYSIEYLNTSSNELVLSSQVVLESGSGWMSVAPPSLKISPNQSGRFIITLTANNLPGAYNGKIIISWQGGKRDHPFILTIASPQVSMSCPINPIFIGTTQGSKGSFNMIIKNLGSCTFTSDSIVIGASIMTIYAQFTPNQVILAPGQSITIQADLIVTTHLIDPQTLKILLKSKGIFEPVASCTVMINPTDDECCRYKISWANSNDAPPLIILCPGESVGTGLIVTNTCTGTPISFTIYTAPYNSNLTFSKTSFTLQPGESIQTTVWVTQPIGSEGIVKWTFYVEPVCGEPRQVDFITQTDSNCRLGNCCNWSLSWDTSDGSSPSVSLCPGETATVTFVISNRCEDKTIVFQILSVDPDSRSLDEKVTIRAGISVRIAVKIKQPTNATWLVTWGFLIKPDCGDDRVISFVSYPRDDCIVSIHDAKVKRKPGEVLTLRGYFTNDPYPLLLDNWETSKMQKPLDPEKAILLELPAKNLNDGHLVLLTGILKDTPIGRVLVVSDLRIIREINTDPIAFAGIGITDTSTILSSNKYGLVFVGGSTSDCVQYDAFGSCQNSMNWRLSTAHISDAIEKYELLKFKAAIPDSNIGVFLGKGRAELDSIYTEDGDGIINGYNPDKHYNGFRQELEIKAKGIFGSKVQEPATKQALKSYLQAIAQHIGSDCCNHYKDPEIYMLITGFGFRKVDRNEPDGQMGLIVTTEPSTEWITDDEFALWIKDILKTCGDESGCKPKIRIELGMSFSGEFIDDLKNAIGSPGLKQIEIVTSARDSEESFMWNGSAKDQSHGIFEHEFVRALSSQALPAGLPDGLFERAFESAKNNDIAAADGLKIDGSVYKENPQYWGSDAPCSKYDAQWVIDPYDPGVPDLWLCPKEIGTAKIVVSNQCPSPNTPMEFTLSTSHTEITFTPSTFLLKPDQSTEVTLSIVQPENAAAPINWSISIQSNCDLIARQLIFHTYPKEGCIGEKPPPEDKICCEWSTSELKDLMLCCPGEFSQTILLNNICTENNKEQVTFEIIASPNNEYKLDITPSLVVLGSGESINVKVTGTHYKYKNVYNWAFIIKTCGQTSTETFSTNIKPISLSVSEPNPLSLCNSVGPNEQRSKVTVVKVTNTGNCTLNVIPETKTNIAVCDGFGKPEIKIRPANFTLAPGETKDVSIIVNAWNFQCQGSNKIDIIITGFVPECPDWQVSAFKSFVVSVSGSFVEYHWTGVDPLPGPGEPPTPWNYPAIPSKLKSIMIKPGDLCTSSNTPPNPTSNRIIWWGDSNAIQKVTFTLTSFVDLGDVCSLPKAIFRIVDMSTPGSDWRIDLNDGQSLFNKTGGYPRDLVLRINGLTPGKWHWWQVEIVTTNATPCPPHTMITGFYVMIYCTQKGVIAGPKPLLINNITGPIGDAADSLVFDVGAKAYKLLELPGVPFASKQQISVDVPWLSVVNVAGWNELSGVFELSNQEILSRIHSVTILIDSKGLEPGWQYVGMFKLTTYWGTTKYETYYRVCFFTVANINYDPFPMRIHSLADYFKPISVLRINRPEENVGNYGIQLSGVDLEFSKSPEGPFTDSVSYSNSERLSALKSNQPNVFVKSKRRYILPPNDLMFVDAVEYSETNLALLRMPIIPNAKRPVQQSLNNNFLSGAMFPVRTETLTLPLQPTFQQKKILLPPSLDGGSVIGLSTWAKPLSAILLNVEGLVEGKIKTSYELPAKLRYTAQDTGFLINLAYDDAMGFVIVWKRELPIGNDKLLSATNTSGKSKLFQDIDKPLFFFSKNSSDVIVSPLEVIFSNVKPNKVVSRFIVVNVPREIAPTGVEVITPVTDKWLSVSASYLPFGENQLEVIIDTHNIIKENLSAISFRYEYIDNDLGDDYEAVKTISIPVKIYVNSHAPDIRIEPEEIEVSGYRNNWINGAFRISNLGSNDLSGSIKTASNLFLATSISSFNIPSGATLDVSLSVLPKTEKGTFFDLLIIQSNDGNYQIPVSVEIQGVQLELKLWIGNERVTFNGKVRRDAKGTIITSKPYPFIENGRTFVPLRLIGEVLGATIDWEPKTGLTKRVYVKVPGRDITLYINDPIATINGFDTPLSSPAIIKVGKTFVPFRFITELLGAQVDWIAAERAVVVSTQE